MGSSATEGKLILELQLPTSTPVSVLLSDLSARFDHVSSICCSLSLYMEAVSNGTMPGQDILYGEHQLTTVKGYPSQLLPIFF